jgi:cyanophycinase
MKLILQHAWIVVVLVVLGLTGPSIAQDKPKGDAAKPSAAGDSKTPEKVVDASLPPGHSQHGEAFNEGPRQKAYLMGGTGKISFPVTSKNPLVQKFIEQGIGQVHGFWYFEAERSFRQAAKLDADCAIAYWGMALANSGNSKRAKGFIEKALKRKDKASRREQLYIDGLNKYLNTSSRKEKAKNYAKALGQIVSDFPDDIEAKAFLAYLYYRSRSDLGSNYEKSDAMIQKVLALEPNHPVHHFRIHLWDHKKASNVVNSSALNGPAAPSIAHMWHMPGHIYSRLKRYDDAAWQQEASARVDHAHMMRDRVMPDQIHNFAHNNEWLIRNLIYIGRWRDAIDLAKNMTELPRHPKYNTLARRGSANYGRMRLFDVLTKYELWPQLIELSAGPYLAPTDRESEQIKRLRYLAVAYIETGAKDKAAPALADLQARLKKVTDAEAKEAAKKAEAKKRADAKKKAEAERKARAAKSKLPANPDPKVAKKPAAKKPKSSRKRSSSSKSSLEKAVAEVQGRLKVAEKDYAAAVPLLKKAGALALYQARVQALAGKTDEAIKLVAGQAKSRTNQCLPLACQVEVLWKAGKKDEAKRAFRKLRDMSGSIQLGAAVFDRLTPIAKELNLPEEWRLSVAPASDLGERPDLNSLGPFRWRPMPAAAWTLKDHEGKPHSLKGYRGKPVIVIFYLGYACLHCAEQLQAFAPAAKKFEEAGISIIAISTDDAKGLKTSIDDYEGDMPFPLVSDAPLDVFRKYRAYDDFENITLHGTYLIDAEGYVRWQDISYEPFMDPEFLLKESKRLLAQGKVIGEEPIVKRPILPVRPRLERIVPAGIGGSLVISGSDVPDEAIERFYQLAQREKARIVVLRGDASDASREMSNKLIAHWEKQKAAGIELLRVDSRERAEDPHVAESLRAATGVWIVAADAKSLHKAIDGTPVMSEAKSLVARGGVLGAAGPIAERLSGHGLLPDAIVDLVAATEDNTAPVADRLKQQPGLVGYEIDTNAALLVRGRRMRSVGPGSVRIHLAAGNGSREAKEIVLNGSRTYADLTALRRSARERINGDFPPTKPAPPKVDKGTLIIIGGGGMPKGIIDRFIKAAGGEKAQIVVLPTAMPDPISNKSRIAEQFRKAGAKTVTVLTGRKRSEVESEAFLKTLRAATGIWFGGGRQWRFADAYLNTKAHAAMRDVLKRGGVIMGSSAGASIQAEYLARANPLGNLDIMAEGYERGLGFLPGAAVDQHFAQRKRFADMTSLIKRYPQLLGIGIDEATAIVVKGQIAEVTGRNAVHFYDANKPAVKDKPDHESVRDGGRYDLVARKVLETAKKKAEKPSGTNPAKP